MKAFITALLGSTILCAPTFAQAPPLPTGTGGEVLQINPTIINPNIIGGVASGALGGIAPQVTTNAGLLGACTGFAPTTCPTGRAIYSSGVWRVGVNTLGDAPPSFWIGVNSPCSTQFGDVGACNPAADGTSFIAVYIGAADLRQWGAKFDGTTDDSVPFSNAFSSGVKSWICPPNKTTVAANVTVTGPSVFDCQMSTWKSPANAIGKPLLIRSGPFQVTKNINFNDAALNTMASTTLTANATAGTTNLQVLNSANFAIGMVISVTLDCGSPTKLHWTSLATAIPDNTHVTILDAIPNCATGIAGVGAGGTGYNSNDALVSFGGTGLNAPLTIKATAAAGALTGGTIEAPGLFTTVPANPISFQNTSSLAALSGTLNINWSGASSTNAVRGAFGVVLSSGATQGTMDQIEISVAPVGLQWNKGGLTSSDGETLGAYQINGPAIAGIVKDVDVHDMKIDARNIWGTAGSCGVGLYINGENTVSITGGNHFSSYPLHCDIGTLDQSGQLDNFAAGPSNDTNTFYGAIFNGAFNNRLDNYYASVTGPDVGYGVGVHFGNSSLNNSISMLQAGKNASDLNVDSTDSIFLPVAGMVGEASPGHIITGDGAGIFSGVQVVNASCAACGGGGTTIFFGNGESATENAVLWRQAMYNGSLVHIYFSFTSALGAGNTYTAKLRINGVDQPQSCVVNNGSFGCEITSPIRMIQPPTAATVSVVSSAGAPANNMNVAFRVQN